MTFKKKAVNPRVIIGEIIAKCWQDEGYKKSFLADPKKYLVEAGINISGKMKIKVIEQNPKITYVVLPQKLNIEILQKLAREIINSAIDNGFKLPENGELRFVQNTAALQYFIIPAKPAYGKSADDVADMTARGTGIHQIQFAMVAVMIGPTPVVSMTTAGPDLVVLVA